MTVKQYSPLPAQAAQIRQTVFVEEQGFVDEFDAIDGYATHFVLFDGDLPVATCRVYSEDGVYYLGRIAVLKEYRGKGLGGRMLAVGEEFARKSGADRIMLHAQCRAAQFYEKAGYKSRGIYDDEEGVPHLWMSKNI